MKKKILLIISMFLFITNVKALTFNVDLTNIEDKGNNGTIGSIEKIDIPNKELDVLFQDIGDEVNFDLTISNTGDRAGTLKSITVESTSESIEYTNSLPETGLAINGNDSNTVTITAKVKEGAVNGKTSSEITITYKYDEGSCPEGEILSADESMCLCPDGKERNENGICVVPEKEIKCEEDEIYNETKKICEKKVVPITPSNPKTLDNIILITLLFVVSGLGIYAVMFKKLNTNKKKVTAGVITGVITLGASFTVLAGVFGLDNLLSAIVNPITKSKTVVVTVNEEIDLIETWDGDCDITELSELTPDNIFEGGSGTEEDPYQVKTAEQLSCLAKSVNNGTTYEGQYIKQTKNIKLNDHLLEQDENENYINLSGARIWYSAGSTTVDYYSLPSEEEKYFAGTYDGDNKVISGLYITNDSAINNGCKGLFGYAKDATFRNIKLSDVYTLTSNKTAALLGYGTGNITIDYVSTAGKIDTNNNNAQYLAGVLSIYNGNNTGNITVSNTTNNVNILSRSSWTGGMIAYIAKANKATLSNDINKGEVSIYYASYVGGVVAKIDALETLVENCSNTGSIVTTAPTNGNYYGGVIGASENSSGTLVLKNSYNTGAFTGAMYMAASGGVIGKASNKSVMIDSCYNSGNLSTNYTFDEENPVLPTEDMFSSYFGGVVGSVESGSESRIIKDSFNTGVINILGAYTGGVIGKFNGTTIDHCYNNGDVISGNFVGGLLGFGDAGNVKNSYNTGRIVQFRGPRAGGITGQDASGRPNIENSYNTGDIVLYDNVTDKATYVGGICSSCGNIKNSYNRGNIISKGVYGRLAGIAYSAGTIENCYNSGTITYDDMQISGDMEISGINSSGSEPVKNSYNLGNIIVIQDGQYHTGSRYLNITGISTSAPVDNSVNMGNITFDYKSPYASYHDIEVGGISKSTVTNSYNGGIIDYETLNAMKTESLNHRIFVGEITMNNNSRTHDNLFSNQNRLALACSSPDYEWTQCTQEQDEAAGTYTSDPAPDILSIINADSSDEDDAPDNAFEILDGETLPTLKVFNQ